MCVGGGGLVCVCAGGLVGCILTVIHAMHRTVA